LSTHASGGEQSCPAIDRPSLSGPDRGDPPRPGGAPALVAIKGIGTETAGALLVAAGDHPDRLRSEAALAHWCGVAPLPASSGETQRHRLSRGGNREANRAPYRLALGRLGWDDRTRADVEQRPREGKTKREIIRCLKRTIAREVYRALVASAA
jgi:transposase